jgi:hypothetical protein
VLRPAKVPQQRASREGKKHSRQMRGAGRLVPQNGFREGTMKFLRRRQFLRPAVGLHTHGIQNSLFSNQASLKVPS